MTREGAPAAFVRYEVAVRVVIQARQESVLSDGQLGSYGHQALIFREGMEVWISSGSGSSSRRDPL